MLGCAIWSCIALLCGTALAKPHPAHRSKLSVSITVADGVLNGATDGHIQLFFAPGDTDPLDDTDVTSSPDYFFGQNVFGLETGSSVTLSGGSNLTTDRGVYGWPNVSLDSVEPGTYSVQAYLNIYEKSTRADGSTVSVHFPCGDGSPGIAGFSTPYTSIQKVEVTGKRQLIELTLNNVTAPGDFTGKEIGGCQQGNYEDTQYLKYVKIRSKVLSDWWKRDTYVGATVLLPHGYNATDKSKRYPVIYSQGHWKGGLGPYNYPSSTRYFDPAVWDSGIIPAANGTAARPTPKLIMIYFRHENPFYDDSYAVNTANIGPWGDAINEELIPLLDKKFNTIAKPYARIQEGGSTGGWESAASLIFRPDLFGACFSSYPDSLSFHRHQDIPLYSNKNAYLRENGGGYIPSIREYDNETEVILATTAQENHWELSGGTSTRSIYGQWDVWNAVYGVQGYNGYPLEPWDKVTGEIYPGAVEYWKHMDLSHQITSNWKTGLNLGYVLKKRIFVYVGTHDTYFLNEGVAEFQKRVEALGGKGWANFTYIKDKPHGGIYNLLNFWDYLELMQSWIIDHAPDGKTPLSDSVTTKSAIGNKFADVMAYGGRSAAVARQAPPELKRRKASVGRWDPGVVLKAQWFVDGRPYGRPFAVKQGETVKFHGRKPCKLQIRVTGSKRGYETETRKSNVVRVSSYY